MDIVFISLLTVAILLLIFSFFKKDNVKKLEEELEELTLSHMQDIYQLKRKVKVLEEELLIGESSGQTLVPPQSVRSVVKNQPQINEILKVQVLSLYQQGLSLEQIAKQSTLAVETVRNIIEKSRSIGLHNE
ncbi:hypothetical protein ELQ35_12560 [Peribacillus cavernae]|uniref:Resolvase HTH domain-containing protein n=1 Tax=Peribacillus cavernae TaxID=1674310 RepID=A0A3S1B4K7_9BACI|nr:hypothetical protein [Peribacillus cavernae]MDQ0218307.1 hypothetical protein [Peribacillus cavernae]RUQ28411.1 hypothetical protein ELQ35_12560 [Peribacillus cavernae]